MGNSIGALDSGVKKLLSQNMGELSGVQGSIVSAAQNREVRSILVTSSRKGEGKTTAAIGLAYGLSSSASADVLLVDGNFTSPKIHTLFNVTSDPGLSDLVGGETRLEEVLRKTEDERLALLPQGASLTTLLDVYRSAGFEETLSSIKKNFDFVIYDCHSVFGSSDASVVARHFDSIALVVECESTRWEVVQMAKDRLESAGGNILGVVLNKRKYYIPQVFYGGSK